MRIPNRSKTETPLDGVISANLRDFCHNSMGNSPWNLLGWRRERHPAALAVAGANMSTLINAMLRFGKGSF